MVLKEFYKFIRGKKVAFCGMGGSNIPLAEIFAKKGAIVTARDKRSIDKLGEKAKRLIPLGVKFITGENYLENLDEDIIFRTPGMPYYLPELSAARKRGAAVTSEMEVFFDLCPCRIFAVTGSDGKTTTTTIISKILESAGKTVHIGGNIGAPLLPRIDTIDENDVIVAELSSFQLISMRRSPDIAVITNISPNHLDVHKDMQEYINAKKNIILHQSAFGRAVLNADNEITASFSNEIRGECLMFSRRHPVEHGAWADDNGKIYFADGKDKYFIMNTSDIKIPGSHNVENYLAAICAVHGYAENKDITFTAGTFMGVEHRNEFVREYEGVKYYNDSIGTTPSRTICGALSLFSRKIILIAGGSDKKIPFDSLGEAIVRKVRLLVLIGSTADKIEAAVKSASGYCLGCPEILRAATLEEAVSLCRQNAKKGDIVSLSPACASFDMFPNFETRGKRFKEIVNGFTD